MRVVIFGATGTLGSRLVQTCLDAGHHVAAFARRPAAIDLEHPQLTVLEGDVLEPRTLDPAIAGSEAVLLALGVRRFLPNRVVSQGTENILAAMTANGVRRLVSVSSLGLGSSRGQFGAWFEALVFRGLARGTFMDLERQEQIIQESDRDWTIVRASRFVPESENHHVRIGAGRVPDACNTITPLEVARFMAAQLVDRTHLHKTPGISY